MAPFSGKGYTTEDELKILKKIKEAREKTRKKSIKSDDEGDSWYRKHYLSDIKGLDKYKNIFEVMEIKKEDFKRLDSEIKSFRPYACRHCDYDGRIHRRIFRMENPPESEKEWRELKKYMKRKYKINFFRVKRGIGINAIISGECPRCGSQSVLFDYSLFMTRPVGDDDLTIDDSDDPNARKKREGRIAKIKKMKERFRGVVLGEDDKKRAKARKRFLEKISEGMDIDDDEVI